MPAMSRLQKTSLIKLIPVVLFMLAVTARLLPGPRTIDDSFITYRYARNILAGNGFVYNAGEQVLGTTTPLYTILLTIIGSTTGGVEAPFPKIALLINAIFDGITCILLFRLGNRIGALYAGVGAALAWAIAPFSVTFAIGGLETSLYVLLLVGALYTHLENKHILTAGLAGLTFLTRPDALILVAPLGIDRIWQIVATSRTKIKPRQILIEALVFSLPVMAWLSFATFYFGSPLPHSVLAKSQAYLLPPNSAVTRLIQHYSIPFMGDISFGVPWIYIGVVLYPTLFIFGARHALKSTKRIWPFILYPWLYLIFFSITNPLIFRWYLTPPLPALFLFILTGAERLISEISRIRSTQKTNQPDVVSGIPIKRAINIGPITKLALVIIVVLLPAAILLNDWTVSPDHGINRPAPSMAWYKLELLYRQAADFVSSDIRIDSKGDVTLAAGDVGVLGYFTPTRILDTVGLNSPQTIKYYPLDPAIYVNAYAISPDLILDEKPDYLVILEVYGRGGLLKDPRFLQTYTLVLKIPTNIYSSDGMLVYKRLAEG